MPSRRRLLAAVAGLGVSVSCSGCLELADLGTAESAYLQVKSVSVARRRDGRRREDEVLFATADGESELECRVAEEYAGIVDSTADIRVTEGMERRLERDFLDVRYVTGFCWSDADGHTCRNAEATRTTFNRVQFGDRAEVVFYSPNVEVLDVDEGAEGDLDRWNVDVTTFDFEARHEGDGTPI